MACRAWALSCAILSVGLASPASAGVVISIGSATVAEGKSATVDVWLSHDPASANSSDAINNYGFRLLITNNGVDNTQLAFAGTQNFSYLTNTSLNPAYLFLGDSSAASPPTSAPGSSGTTHYPNDTWNGADSTASGNPVTVGSGDKFLLASLVLTASTAAPPMVVDSFTISLVPGSGNGSVTTNPFTYFDNFDFQNGTEQSAAPFTSTSGTITVAASVVPEPASLVLASTGLLLAAGFWGARRLRPRPSTGSQSVSDRRRSREVPGS
jgi:hypothetical protein